MARKVYKHCLPSASHSKLRMFMSCTGTFKVFKGERKVHDVILGAIEQYSVEDVHHCMRTYFEGVVDTSISYSFPSQN
jgi:hypothetical protein